MRTPIDLRRTARMAADLGRAKPSATKPTPALLAAAVALALAACGGDGGDAAPAPPPAADLTVTGTAATGDPIAGQTVTFKCASGSASGVTGSDGTYSVAVASGAWPCLGQIAAASGTVLTTVATGSGTSAVANITPATQLVVASAIAADPVPYFASFGSSQAAAFTAAVIAAAQARVLSTLAAAGVDFSSAGDLLAGAFTPAYDTALLALDAQLVGSGTTLDMLTTSIAAAAAPSAVSVASELLLAPAASTCGSLRSATYRVLTPTNGAGLAAQSGLIAVDAATLAVTHADGTTGQWVPNGTCRYAEQAGSYSADITVTPAGVLVARYTVDGQTYRALLGFADQRHTLDELAGDWNVIGMARESSDTYVGTAGSLTYGADGVLTAASNCQNNATWAVDACTAVSPSVLALVPALAQNADGGFDVTDPNSHAVTGRVFAFRPGSGALMFATITDDGELFVGSPPKSVSLPAVGAVTSSWNLDSDASFLAMTQIYVTGNTVTGVDTAAGSWVRNHTTGDSPVTRPETLFANNPRAGYVYRPAATVTDSSGAPTAVNTYTALTVPGTGLYPLILVTSGGTKLFELASSRP